ncbi:PREDICTED: THAP domain-containing protein 4-like [Dinoponera quadriceps]|uniref:THAP domain-containing protein 4-like n=1 Tax=Dinoponera quadriceps TaxID=609295 RepID=A0A6P3XC32_DINQU|nr:PREDICTED: THAP domain-containing protein 4-like [Dinoponera quadriceps]XP_014475877.1 PREDICTED: THAP domain-containing protein 4-like [Dinoponera quadriceps]XP_014475878.1 PREDICTED: THAP domain-containing protein 4-like [Dinoponera quadriceps]XP_014475879.1 PREDICTED: THAP domain-containing protein 4-like [Dinoponera quadriceps]
MPGCVAAWCTNSSSKGFKMCNFPRNKERREAWVKNMNRQDWSPTPHSALCEAHFASDMWEKVRIDGKKKLKACAVPTIFVTNCVYMFLKEKERDTPMRRKNILDSVSILRKKSRYSTKKGAELQKVCDRQLHRKQVTNNEETNNNNEFRNVYENNIMQLEELGNISKDLNDLSGSINNGT